MAHFEQHKLKEKAVYPKFELNRSPYNLDTYVGRLCHNLDLIDPSTLFISNSKLNESVNLLENFKNGIIDSSTTDKDLWKAQKIKQAVIHPDTGEKIPMPFRMSGFVPFNCPIMLGILIPNLSMAQILCFQSLNQTHCAFVNYANRNATKPTNMFNILQGYTGAVGAAASISLGLNMILRKANALKPFIKNVLQRVIPVPAIMTASTLNVLLMRKNELNEGIDVMDKKGKVVGTSQVAAKSALTEMAVSRATLGGSCMLLPALLMTSAEKMPVLKKIPKLKMPVNLLICALSFFVTLPACNAIYPQISQINVESLESSIKTNTKEAVLYYNRGL